MEDHPKREMLDIHMHLLPGVDDGAEDLNGALLMLKGAGEEGIRGIFATPHSEAFDRWPKETEKAYRQLCAQASRFDELAAIPIYRGCEILCEPFQIQEIIQALKSGRYPTMNGTEYVLIEFSRWTLPDMADICAQAVERLVEAGYKPIIAHMERYEAFQNNMDLVNRFRTLGARIQVNVCDLFEQTDSAVKEWARALVLQKKTDFLGSDAHNPGNRPPSAARGLEWLYGNVDGAYADTIAWGNAQNLLLEREEAKHGADIPLELKKAENRTVRQETPVRQNNVPRSEREPLREEEKILEQNSSILENNPGFADF